MTASPDSYALIVAEMQAADWIGYGMVREWADRIAALEASPGCVVVGEIVESEAHGHAISFPKGYDKTIDALPIGTKLLAAAPKPSDTFHGIKLQVDQSLPPDVMELRSGTQTVRASVAPKASGAVRPLSDGAIIAGWEAKADALDNDDTVDWSGQRAAQLRDCANELRSRAELGFAPQADPAPPVAGEVLAWLCMSNDGSAKDATTSLQGRDVYVRMGRTITPLCDARMVAAKDAVIDRQSASLALDRKQMTLLDAELTRAIARAEAAEQRAEAMAGLLRELLELRQASQEGRLTERHELDIVRDAKALLRDGLAGQEGAG